MSEEGKTKALALLQAAMPEYKLRWYDGHGDFSGREHTIDAFNVPVSEQRNFLVRLRTVRAEADRLAGGHCIFVMHSPEATKEHYSHLL